MTTTRPDPVDAESQVDTVLTTTHSQVLHISGSRDDGRPLCGTTAAFVSKPLSVYPPAHRNWCRHCLQVRRDAGGEPLPEWL